MSAMNLTLGTPEVSLASTKTFTPKPPSSSGPKPIAVLVAHGMGQQVPYETIDGVAQAVQRGVQTSGACVTSAVIRAVRLGTQNIDEVEPELVRAEFQVTEQNGNLHEVHIYEAYWAPFTEGKVTASDVVNFLFNAGWNGIANTNAKTYRRWMFDKECTFELPTEKLVVVFLGIMALLAALVFVNAVVAAAAASHAIGTANLFPSGPLLVQLTWDFVLVDLAGVFVAVGIFGFGRSAWNFVRLMGWFFIFLGALTILVSAVLMAGHLERWNFFARAVPGNNWSRFVYGSPMLVMALWALEFWAASKARGFLIQYVGDVAAYIAAHTVSKFWEVRQQIWKTAMRVAGAVYRARTADNKDFMYNKIVMVGHSLGSVISYDVLNGLILEGDFAAQSLNVAARTRMFLTFGSPLDKTAFLFRTLKDMRSVVREVGAAAVQPMITDYKNRPQEWVNLWSPADIISGQLDYYDPPTVKTAKHKANYKGVPVHPRAVNNLIDPDAGKPLAAHIQYWDGALFAKHLSRAILS
jgi:hypothetical protein